MNANRRQPMGIATVRTQSIRVAMRDIARNFREASMDNSGYIIASS